MNTHVWRLALFGATGAIGSAVGEKADALGWEVLRIARRAPDPNDAGEWLRFDPLEDDCAAVFKGREPFDAVCFAHGANLGDSLRGFDASRHLELYRANCLSVIAATAAFVEGGLLASTGARVVAVSSIWQDRARSDKLSYIVSKAALGGFVRSACVDLGREGHLINAVLPGVLDTPMTRANLTPEQIGGVKGKTSVGRLADLDTVVETILLLCSASNRSISGQSVAVDLGMSNVQLL